VTVALDASQHAEGQSGDNVKDKVNRLHTALHDTVAESFSRDLSSVPYAMCRCVGSSHHGVM
jgi:hypothetical protein